MPGDALTTEENQVNLTLRFLCIVLLATVFTTALQQIGKNIRAIEEIKIEISEMKSQISALESYPIGYSEPLAWYTATDPAGPDEQPTIEQPPEDPAIRYPETKMVKIEETTDDLSDPYWRALHGWPEGEICELK